MCKTLKLNICAVDQRAPSGSLDLVCYFTASNRYGLTGRLWVELKVFGRGTFDRKVQEEKDALPAKLSQNRAKDASLCAVLLVAAKVERVGSSWGKPSLYATLWKGGASDWCDVAGTFEAKGRGQVKGVKPPLATVPSFFRQRFDRKA